MINNLFFILKIRDKYKILKHSQLMYYNITKKKPTLLASLHVLFTRSINVLRQNYHSPPCSVNSTLSSGLNSLPTILWEDFIKPHCGARFSEVQATMFGKILGEILISIIKIGKKVIIQCMILK